MSDEQAASAENNGSTEGVVAPAATGSGQADNSTTNPPRKKTPNLTAGGQPMSRHTVNFADQPRSPPPQVDGPLSPAAADRVFPIRSVVSVDPTPTPGTQQRRGDSYFPTASRARRQSLQSAPSDKQASSQTGRQGQPSEPKREPSGTTTKRTSLDSTRSAASSMRHASGHRDKPGAISNAISGGYDDTASTGTGSTVPSVVGGEQRAASPAAPSFASTNIDDLEPLVTARFKHVVSEGGHAIITGRGGETLQRCEDEPIHIPGAVQSFGLLMALEEQQEGKLVVRVVSENSKQMIGFTPKQLFALESFTDILSEDQADNLLDHVDFIRDEDADVVVNGPEVFTMSIRAPSGRNQKLWCAMHINDRHHNLLICEFELEDDPINPLVPPNEASPEPPEDTLDSKPTEEELTESTLNTSKPLRVLRSARKRKGEAAAMEVFNIMSQVQEQLAAAPNLDKFLKILVGVVRELTGFHRVMVYQFDQAWNGRVVTELVDPRATKDLYKGLNFPASDIPKQARDLYKVNKVRMLYDRDLETARLVCRTVEDLENPLDLTHAYLRAMSPIHLKYLANMAVRSSMSISINAFDELWGLIACHGYGGKGMRVSFPIRKMCRLVGDTASRNIERLSYASRLQARKLINTVPTSANPSGYIIASSEDLLKLFDADFGLLSIHDETKILGHIEQSQEALAMLEYLRMRSITNVMTSQDIKIDFPDLRYPPGFDVIAGLLLVPLSSSGHDFIVFFRKGQLKEVKWAGNPYEKFIKEGTEGYLEPRKSFRTWSETVVGKCREWTEEEIETAAVLCLVYGKFIDVWRQKEAALQNSQLTRLLLANSAHEVRTPLNAIINYLEIALEGSLDQETRDNLAKSHSASKSLIYVINDLLDLTKTEEGGELTKDEVFELKDVFKEATDMFSGDARRKGVKYEVIEHPGVPPQVVGDSRRIRQAISNITANAIQNTSEGGVKVEMYLASRSETTADVEISVSDTGSGITAKKLDALFRELEQVQSEGEDLMGLDMNQKAITDEKIAEGQILGLGLAVVARIVRNMNGQLRLKSEDGKGSRFVIQFPLDLPGGEGDGAESSQHSTTKAISPPTGDGSTGSVTPMGDDKPCTPPVVSPGEGERTLINRGQSSVKRQSSGLKRKSSSARRGSADSGGRESMRSAMSTTSMNSAQSGRSEADRLIEAIQEPHYVDGWSGFGDSARKSNGNSRPSSTRPSIEQRHTSGTGGYSGSPTRRRGGSKGQQLENRPNSMHEAIVPEHLREQALSRPGVVNVPGQGMPMTPVRMPDEFSETDSTRATSTVSRGSVSDVANSSRKKRTKDAPTADHMHVLVAEDDPVNSRIIKKRLEKLGHEVYLTVNGEECAGAYGEKTGYFDIVLMDMQMPIVDGLTSTKLIRSFEKSHPSHILSSRASLNGRVPIIAVSASLIEKDRQMYIDGGFDGWILKPVAFERLSKIVAGIVDSSAREGNLYRPGGWERGGWFDRAQKDVYAADTRPNQRVPFGEPSEGVKIAAMSDNPMLKEDGGSRQTEEQKRMEETSGRGGEGKTDDGTQKVDLPQNEARISGVADDGDTANETKGADAIKPDDG
ncbi:hypothetical protein B0A48_15679 [Cryoendolithus antarcticus]|uniref:Cyanobacterial phytochrome B n=1 Tax=Cryoendolithus antarcticus TaxID=1507870 RepID=A0A1V8SHF7_9PEZI|nr:hypothetical protein B0A48_15679 [Cryoendolithus antarcticus]